ncbi:HTH_38 domain-containing protein [Trichonephila clavipes]|nr:HTH_38 domain-containing protein [Trichonephila clavipes]
MCLRKQRSAFDQVSEFDKGRIMAYRDCGLSFREIGSRVGRNQTTVMRISDRWIVCAYNSTPFTAEWSVRKTSIAWSILDAEPQTSPPPMEEFVAVDDNIVYSGPIMVEKSILELVQSSKNIIDADSDDKNEMNNTASFSTSSEMRNVMKRMHSYLDAHSKGEMNNEMDDVEQFVDKFMLEKTMQRKISDYFPKIQ